MSTPQDAELATLRAEHAIVMQDLSKAVADNEALRAQLAAKEQDAKRMAGDNLEILDKLEELAVSYGKLQDAHAALQEQHKRAVEDSARLDWLGKSYDEGCGRPPCLDVYAVWAPGISLRAAIDAARKEDKP